MAPGNQTTLVVRPSPQTMNQARRDPLRLINILLLEKCNGGLHPRSIMDALSSVVIVDVVVVCWVARV